MMKVLKQPHAVPQMPHVVVAVVAVVAVAVVVGVDVAAVAAVLRDLAFDVSDVQILAHYVIGVGVLLLLLLSSKLNCC